MIHVTCSNCGREHECSDALAGLVLLCKGCSNRLQLPPRSSAPADGAGRPSSPGDRRPVADAPVPPLPPPVPIEPSPAPTALSSPVGEGDRAGPPPEIRPEPAVSSLPPRPAADLPFWLRHLHWLLLLALLPLAFSLLRPSAVENDINARVDESMDKATPEQRERLEAVLAALHEGKATFEVLFAALPGERLAGAFLPRRTLLHWTFAAGAAVLFLAFFRLLALRQALRPHHLLLVGLFTATAGMVLLFLFQAAADWSQDVLLTGRGVLVLVFYVVKFIGFSYRAALAPESGFFLSFVGYTAGVGLCEEVVKALPLLWLYRLPCRQGWRRAFVLGLASGAGFGIAEGVMYAGDYYNGIRGPEIYLVRFVSCVALHAVWTGSVGITLHRRQELIQHDMAWYEYVPPVLLFVAVPAVLHGLYDTFLKKELTGWALAVAGFSFLVLAVQISRQHGEDSPPAAGDTVPPLAGA
jgi:RsiW-degrading membrane proteinase PrsW (M82 family)